jgi:hypothetical protein
MSRGILRIFSALPKQAELAFGQLNSRRARAKLRFAQRNLLRKLKEGMESRHAFQFILSSP